MTGSLGTGGPVASSAAAMARASADGQEAEIEARLIDRLVEMVLALEPIELKQHDAPDGSDEPDTSEAPEAYGARGGTDAVVHNKAACFPDGGRGGVCAPTLAAESTQRMLDRMRAVLDREADRLGVDGAEGKAAVDQVALIARTLEKIDQMERLIAGDRARDMARTLSPDERAEMRETVRQLILAAAERLATERREDGADRVAQAAEAAPAAFAPEQEA